MYIMLSSSCMVKKLFIYFCNIPDLDECQSPDACGANHVCNNTVGSYRCECLNGFVANSGAQDPLNPVCIGKKKHDLRIGEIVLCRQKKTSRKLNIAWFLSSSQRNLKVAILSILLITQSPKPYLVNKRKPTVNFTICEWLNGHRSHFISIRNMIVRVSEVMPEYDSLLLTTTDVSTTCAVVFFRVKMSWITSVAGNKL